MLFFIFEMVLYLRWFCISIRINIVIGLDFWYMVFIFEYGILLVKCIDGFNGVRGSCFFNSVLVLCILCGMVLGVIWNFLLFEEVG